MRPFLAIIILLSCQLSISGQNIGIGTNAPHASAALEIKASDKGFLMPRTSTVSRTGIVDPAKGLMLYDSTTGSFWYHSGTAWVQVENRGRSWSTTGNAGTNSAVHFIGTTDKRSLQFKINNEYAGAIDTLGNVFIGPGAGVLNSSFGSVAIGSGAFKTAAGGEMVAIGLNSLSSNVNGIWNTALGSYALALHKTGNLNTAVGYAALDNDSSGASNSAFGAFALSGNKSGFNNNAFGTSVLRSNISGSYNTGAGSGALFSNVDGNQNAAFGRRALYMNTSGNSNVAIGNWALHENKMASNLVAIGDSALFNNGLNAVNPLDATGNTAVGSKALYSNTKGAQNTASGFRVLYSNTVGNYNTAFGYQALDKNGTGSIAADDASRNTAIGHNAMLNNTSGGYSTALGFGALSANTIGYFNCAIGYTALGSNIDGFENAALGLGAGESSTSNTFCTFVGNRTNATTNLSNATAIGYNAFVNSSNKIRLGNSAVTVIEGAASYTVSDGRFKQDVNEQVPGLEFITSLRPVSYRYKSFELDQFLHQDNKESSLELKQSDYKQSESMVHLGFIAQEVEALILEKKYGLSFVKAPANSKDNYSMAYGELIAPLVKAVQEQQTLIEIQNKKMTAMEADIEMLKAALRTKQ